MALTSTEDVELSVDGYCTLAHIEPYIPHRSLTVNSKPTRAHALYIVRDIYQEINGLLDVLGYQIPVASTNGTAIRIVGRLNALGVAAAIEASTYSADGEEASGHSTTLRRQYEDAWKRLEDGKVSLPNATRKSNYIRRRDEQRAWYQFDEDSYGDERSPTFSTGMHW